MTRPEKQELRKLIQKLPQNNLARVVEIVQHSKLADSRPSDEYFVDLEKEVQKLKTWHEFLESILNFNPVQNIVFQDNVTLWRLFYYVKAVEKARELML